MHLRVEEDTSLTHERKVRAPIVEAAAASASVEVNPENCLFNDDQNFWCISTTSPMLVAGWEWGQTADANDDDIVNWIWTLSDYIEL